MPRIAAVLHTHNDEQRLGRCLETLYPCDEILIVDHGSRDRTLQVARVYGAKIVVAREGITANGYLAGADANWVLCLDPRESLTEGLAASLYEWKSGEAGAATAYSVAMREETREGWTGSPAQHTRLVPSNWRSWQEWLPAQDPSAARLEGELLRFALP